MSSNTYKMDPTDAHGLSDSEENQYDEAHSAERKAGGNPHPNRVLILVAVVVLVIIIVLAAVLGILLGNRDGTVETPAITVRFRDALPKGRASLVSLRNDYSWGERLEAEAVMAMQLSDSSWYKSDTGSATIKHLNLDLLTALTRYPGLDHPLWFGGKLSHYINAVVATCQNPRNFYGFDLIAILNNHMDAYPYYHFTNRFAYSWGILALCNAGEEIKDSYMDIFTNETGGYSSELDEAGIVAIAAACVFYRDGHPDAKSSMNKAVQYLLPEQAEDGSFWNEYTTGLVLQAINASKTNITDQYTSAGNYLLKRLGSKVQFSNIGMASQALPALAQKSYAHIGGICENLEKRMSNAVKKGRDYLLSRRNTNGGWIGNSGSMVFTIQLVTNDWYNASDPKKASTVQEMKLELATALSKDPTLDNADMYVVPLAMYINGLVSVCQDPTDFHGMDLIAILKNQMEGYPKYNLNSPYFYGLAVATLCNAGVDVSESQLQKMAIDVYDNTMHAAIAAVALSCIGGYEANVSAAIQFLSQSNASELTLVESSLFLQALVATNDSTVPQFKRKNLIESILSQQSSDGSFINEDTTLSVLPALANTFLANARKTCKKADPEANTTMSPATETVYISIEDNISAVKTQKTYTVKVPKDASIHDALFALQASDSTFSFNTTTFSFGEMARSFLGIEAGQATSTYWKIHYNGKSLSMSIDRKKMKNEDAVKFTLTKY